MTFPLMSAGLVRAQRGAAGESVAMLYFTNSLGAAAGVLASGFVLIAWAGLPGTLRTAGILNLVIAAVVWFLARPARHQPVRKASAAESNLGLLLAIAFFTGLASFVYEISWIRMLSLVLGASTHSFELMLATFILGLALGGLAVRRRVDAAPEPARLIAWVLVAKGLAALATLPVYDFTFTLMEALLKGLARSETGYLLFNLSGAGIAATGDAAGHLLRRDDAAAHHRQRSCAAAPARRRSARCTRRTRSARSPGCCSRCTSACRCSASRGR